MPLFLRKVPEYLFFCCWNLLKHSKGFSFAGIKMCMCVRTQMHFMCLYIIRRKICFRALLCLRMLNSEEKCNFLLGKFGGMENS